MVKEILEPAHKIPLADEVDICVLGGSCTGVFAAIRAARLGMRVAIVEKANAFGGVATISLVSVWHSQFDEVFKRKIIGGLTVETMDRLKSRNAVERHERCAHFEWRYNPFELMIELDEMVREANVRPFLQTVFSAPHLNDQGQLHAVIIDDKSGRRAIKAKMFIDATGDGDLAHRLSIPTYVNPHFQPPTTCATLTGWDAVAKIGLGELIKQHGAEFGLKQGFAWSAPIPNSPVTMLAGTRVYHKNCAEADALTEAEIEGRRQVRALMDLMRKYVPNHNITLQGLPARIGIRETRHVRCRHHITGQEVLLGTRFPDAIANGSYRVDIHHQDKPGITFRYLDGREDYVVPGQPTVSSRWHPESLDSPTFYQIPYRALLPDTNQFTNVLMAGRMIDADPEAHGALRVMVNMNQTGEAAGVAATLAIRHNQTAPQIDPNELRQTLAAGGSVII